MVLAFVASSRVTHRSPLPLPPSPLPLSPLPRSPLPRSPPLPRDPLSRPGTKVISRCPPTLQGEQGSPVSGCWGSWKYLKWLKHKSCMRCLRLLFHATLAEALKLSQKLSESQAMLVLLLLPHVPNFLWLHTSSSCVVFLTCACDDLLRDLHRIVHTFIFY